VPSRTTRSPVLDLEAGAVRSAEIVVVDDG
jgi:hypothetical protein